MPPWLIAGAHDTFSQGDYQPRWSGRLVLSDWLVIWSILLIFIGYLVDRLSDWLVVWLVGCLIDWLVDKSVVCRIDCFIHCFSLDTQNCSFWVGDLVCGFVRPFSLSSRQNINPTLPLYLSLLYSSLLSLMFHCRIFNVLIRIHGVLVFLLVVVHPILITNQEKKGTQTSNDVQTIMVCLYAFTIYLWV